MTQIDIEKNEEEKEKTKSKALILNKTEISQPAILLHSYLTFYKMKQ